MPLHHGSKITAKEVEELISSRFDARLFASLCNSIVWGLSGRQCSSLPSFTERVNAKDGGLDIEWPVSIPETGFSSPLLGVGWNIFQCKQRDVYAANRGSVVAGIRSSLTGALKKVAKAHGAAPDRYLLLTNIDLLHKQKHALKEAILRGYAQPNEVRVEVVGAAELAAFLNDLPHVRSAFFVPSRFTTWEQYWVEHARERILGAHVNLVGRDAELEGLRQLVHDPNVRVVVLCGPHQIGKTRLALEATRDQYVWTVVATDPRGMTGQDFSALAGPHGETLVIVEAPGPDDAGRFANCALSQGGIKLFITLPTAEHALMPALGYDDRVQKLQVEPLTSAASEELLKATGAKLDYSLCSWIIDQAGGNPGVLLLAGKLGPDLREGALSFLQDVSRALQRRVERVLGRETMEVLRLLSVLTHVGVRGRAVEELALVCRFLGGPVDVNRALNALPKLEAAGVLRLSGSYAEVRPPVLGSGLAAEPLRGRLHEVLGLYSALEPPGRQRLIRRLAMVDSDEAHLFWERLFAADWPLADLQSALRDPKLLHLVSGCEPERAATMISGGLQSMSVQERLAIDGERRRELMWAMEELLFREPTWAVALRCVALLAEAENERWGNNATGVFCECFVALHPQLPLPFGERTKVLREITAEGQSSELRQLGVKAITSAFRGPGGTALRRSIGAEPLASRPRTTWDDVFDYHEALMDMLLGLAESDDEGTAAAARNAIPRVLGTYAREGRPETVVSTLENVTRKALSGELAVDVAEVADALRWARKAYERGITAAEEAGREEDRQRLQECAQQVSELIDLLEGADLSSRIKRWAGRWSHVDDSEVQEGGERIYRYEKELRAAAKELLESPDEMTDELLGWLCSDKAQKAHVLLWWLGKQDKNRTFAARMEAAGGDRQRAVAFSSYFGGMARVDPDFVRRRLDGFTDAGGVCGAALVQATAYLPADETAVQRVEKLIASERVSPAFAEGILVRGQWADPLTPTQFVRLLQAIHSDKIENIGAVMDFLGMWLHMGKALEGDLAEFAWDCLEELAPTTTEERYDYDRVASNLALSDSERAFRLFEALAFDSECWNPVERHVDHLLWDALKGIDRRRAFRILISAVAGHEFVYMRLQDDVGELIEDQDDAQVLLELAKQDRRLALLVSKRISLEHPGFWTLAFQILEAYPGDEQLIGALSMSIQYGQRVICGPMSAHLEKRADEVDRVLSVPSTPSGVRSWLSRLATALRRAAKQERTAEADWEINN